jgi:sec-independent protein translocase protein TatB
MPSFPDSIFLFVLALLLFGPKRLPVLARELGKWVGEFRRASNDFKMQMEDELRLSEQAERNKQIAAMEAAAPITPPLDATEATTPTEDPDAIPAEYALPEVTYAEPPEHLTEPYSKPAYEIIDGVPTPLPIATSGDLKLMPPTTGLPTPRTSTQPAEATPAAEIAAENTAETTPHGN